MKLVRVAVLAAFAVPTILAAQEQGEIPVSVEVVGVPLTLDIVGNTNFGTVFNRPHEEVIDPQAPTAGQTTAALVIGTVPNTGVIMTFSACPISLSSAGGTLEFYHLFAVNHVDDVQGGGDSITLPECSGQVSTGVSAPGSDPALQYLYLWMGGRLAITGPLNGGEPTPALAGIYTGSVTITVDIF